MALPFVTGEELVARLPMVAAIDALAEAFGGEVEPRGPPRSHVATGDGDLLLMPAFGPEGVGVKLVTVNLENPPRGLPLVHAVYVVFAPETMAPVVVLIRIPPVGPGTSLIVRLFCSGVCKVIPGTPGGTISAAAGTSAAVP